MNQATEFLSILPNLSIGVIAVLGMIYLVRYFTDKAEIAHRFHLRQLEQYDERMRGFEKEVRETTMARLEENTRLFQRIVELLNRRR